MTSKFLEIVPTSHRQENCIPFAAIRHPDPVFRNDSPFLERIDDFAVPNIEQVQALYSKLAAELTDQYGGHMHAQRAAE
jgi:hypothetical protein